MRLWMTIFAAVALLLNGCGGKGNSVSEPDARNIFTPEYATHFTIDSVGGDRVITTISPWQGADSIKLRYTLGKPAKRIVTTSSTHIALLDAIGAADRIVGVSGKKFISNDRIRLNDTIADVGYDSNFNYETLLALRPDLVLLYGIDGSSIMEQQLTRLGIPYIYIGDYLEEDPIGKAEWLVVLGEITGKREVSDSVFAVIPTRYNAIKDSVSRSNVTKTAVMLNSPYGDSWFMPPTGSYMVRLISDAGGNYLFPENTGSRSVPVDMERAYQLASVADVWLNPGMCGNMSTLINSCPSFRNLNVVTRKEVYNNNLRATADGGNDFFEGAIVHPDAVLADLVKIFHPELYPDTEFTYYQRLE